MSTRVQIVQRLIAEADEDTPDEIVAQRIVDALDDARVTEILDSVRTLTQLVENVPDVVQGAVDKIGGLPPMLRSVLGFKR